MHVEFCKRAQAIPSRLVRLDMVFNSYNGSTSFIIGKAIAKKIHYVKEIDGPYTFAILREPTFLHDRFIHMYVVIDIDRVSTVLVEVFEITTASSSSKIKKSMILRIQPMTPA